MGVGCGRGVGVRLMFWVLGVKGLLPFAGSYLEDAPASEARIRLTTLYDFT